jgi:hypothetical protein
VGGPRTRCHYCLNEVLVPPAFRRPLADEGHFAAELERLAARVRERRAALRGRALYPAALALVYLAPLSFVLAATWRAIREGDPHYSFQIGFWGVGLYTVVFWGFAATALRWGAAPAYKLARLPTASLTTYGRAAPACPACGARLTFDAEALTAACAHCGTSSLLPATLVSERLWRKHARVMEARQELHALGARSRRGVPAGGRAVGWGLVALSLTYAVLNPLWNLWLFPLKGLEPAGLLAGTAVFSALMLFVGIVTVVNSR